MTTYKPIGSESNQVKYLRFLARQFKNAATKVKSDSLKEYLLADSKLHEDLAIILSLGKHLEQKSPEVLDFVMEPLIKKYGPLDVTGLLNTSAVMRLNIMENLSIPEEDKKLIKKIDKKARKYSKTLKLPYIF